MGWIYLVIAGLCEVWWAVGLKYTEGFTRLVPSAITAAGMIASFYFLAHAIKSLPLGMAYAVWTGIGTVGTLLFSVIVLHDHISIAQVICLAMVVCGIGGLKYFA